MDNKLSTLKHGVWQLYNQESRKENDNCALVGRWSRSQ